MYRISTKEQYEMSRSCVQRLNNCAQNMQLKKVNDCKDGLTWRCRKVHCITTDKGQYKVKDVKVSI